MFLLKNLQIGCVMRLITNKLLKKFIMIKILGTLILGLFLTTQLKADDIREFQIEGISVEDSALDHFSKEDINNGVKHFYKDKKFLSITIRVNSDSYDKMDFVYKPKDEKYKIYGIRGSKIFKNIKDCKIEYKKAVNGLSEIFINLNKNNEQPVNK